MNRVVFSKKSDDWETPQDLFDKLDREFQFEIDLAANPENNKCKNRRGYYTDILSLYSKARDQKMHDFSISNKFMYWCNPPYSKCKEFVKLVSESNMDCVMLLPSRTDTRWFHEFIYNKPNVEIRFIKGRLKFSGAKFNAPFPSMIVIFRRKENE